MRFENYPLFNLNFLTIQDHNLTKSFRKRCYSLLLQWENISQKQPAELLCKKGVLKIFANFTGKNLC